MDELDDDDDIPVFECINSRAVNDEVQTNMLMVTGNGNRLDLHRRCSWREVVKVGLALHRRHPKGQSGLARSHNHLRLPCGDV